MSWVVGIIGLLLIGAWVEQIWTLRRRKRQGPVVKWWKDPEDDGPDGDY